VIRLLDIDSEEVVRPPESYDPWFWFAAQRQAGVEVEHHFVRGMGDAHVHLSSGDPLVLALWAESQMPLASKILRLAGGRASVLPAPLGFCGMGSVAPAVAQSAYRDAMIALPSCLTDDEARRYARYDRSMVLTADRKHEGRAVPLFTTRGCPNACAFCLNTISGKVRGWREQRLTPEEVRSVATGMRERWGATGFVVLDNDFFDDAGRALAVAGVLRDVGLPWYCMGTSASVLSFLEETGIALTQLVRRYGMTHIHTGLEGVGLTERRLSGKNADIKRLGELSVAAARELGRPAVIFLNVSFLPGETPWHMRETARFLRAYGADPSAITPAMRHNFTASGLGQCAVPYFDLAAFVLGGYDEGALWCEGQYHRLLPNVIPASFLDTAATPRGGARRKTGASVSQECRAMWQWYRETWARDLLHVTAYVRRAERGSTFRDLIHTRTDALAYGLLARNGVLGE